MTQPTKSKTVPSDKDVAQNIFQEVAQQEPKPVAPVPSASPTQVHVLSNQDTFISDLVKEQPTLEEVERMNVSSSPVVNLLELPEECRPLYKVKYRFRWLAKDKNLEARLRSSKWVLCTRTNSPYIKQHRFKNHGAVEQSGMLLAFMTEDMGKAREEAPARKSAALVKHYTEDLAKTGSKEAGGFYKPESAGSDEDDEKEEGLIEGRDF